MYPHLQPNDQHGTPTSIFLFEAGLSLSDRYVPKTVVEIDLRITFTQGALYRDWQSQTQIYDELASTGRSLRSPIDQISLEDQDQVLTLSFQATYWANLFARFSEAKYAAREPGDAELMRREEAFPRRFLSKVFVMQELWATPNVEHAGPQRMAILLWKFHQIPSAETPTTSWRRLILPVSLDGTQISDVRPMEAAMTIDPGLQQSVPIQQLPLQSYAEDYYRNHTDRALTTMQDRMLIIQNPTPSESTSPDSELHTDVGSSLPSATSASFPTSFSGSTSHTQPSQQGSFASQGGRDMFTSFEPFVSHDPEYIDAQHANFGAHDAVMLPQEGQAYDVDETIYGTQDQTNAFYQGLTEFPAFETQYGSQQMDEATVVATTQTFTGGEIQLTYENVPHDLDAQQASEQTESMLRQEQEQEQHHQHHQRCQEDQIEEYESPLAAPQAHMISQHHILQLQHLEEPHEHSVPHSHQVDEVYNEEVEVTIASRPPQPASHDVGTSLQEPQHTPEDGDDHHGCEQNHQQEGLQYEPQEEYDIQLPPWKHPQDVDSHPYNHQDVDAYEDTHGIIYEGLENWHGEVGPDAFVQDHDQDAGEDEETVLEVRIKEEDEAGAVDGVVCD